jgi:hypothetical protein
MRGRQTVPRFASIGIVALTLGARVQPAEAQSPSPGVHGIATEIRKAYFAERAVDRDARHDLEREDDEIQQRAQEFVGRAEHDDAPAPERRVDRKHGSIDVLPHLRPATNATRRLASSSSASSCDGCGGMSGRTTAPLGTPSGEPPQPADGPCASAPSFLAAQGRERAASLTRSRKAARVSSSRRGKAAIFAPCGRRPRPRSRIRRS